MAKPRKDTGKLSVKADAHEDHLAGHIFVKDRNDRVIRVPADATGNKMAQRVLIHAFSNQFSRYLDTMCVKGVCNFDPKQWKSLADTVKIIGEISEVAYQPVREEQAPNQAPNQLTEVLIRVRQLALSQRGGKNKPLKEGMETALSEFAAAAEPVIDISPATQTAHGT